MTELSSSLQACEEVQIALVGHLALTTAAQQHVDGCQECGFLAFLSRSFQAAPSAAGDLSGPLGTAVSQLLDHALESGEALLGRWQLLSILGRGGQGNVYRARDLETRDEVAVKVVRVRDGDRAASETANARRVRHDHVCRVYHTERHGELRLIVMELIDGPTLASVRALPRREALRIFRAVCRAVAAAHEAGVLHLDLKPQNVLLRGGREPVVSDFGLSVQIEAGVAEATGGTPRYMAPEQRRHGPVDRRTDVYALGRLLEHLLGPRVRLFRTALRAATAEDPSRRPTSVAELLRLLDRPLRRRRVLKIAGAVLVLLAGLAVAVSYFVPPPRGARGAWHADLWGIDHVPHDAWNVALNRRGEGLPSVEVGDPMYACGQHPNDLLDGAVEYPSWEHGVAFLRAPTVKHPDFSCVELSYMGHCGTLSPDDHLCEYVDDLDDGFRVLAETARDMDRFPPERRVRLGQAVPRKKCGDRTITVTLDREYPVMAVRTWHRGSENVPGRFRVELLNRDGTWVEHGVVNNRTATEAEWFSWGSTGSAVSGPVTMTFPEVVTGRVRFIMDTCSTLKSSELAAYLAGGSGKVPGIGWLYEIEIFARLSPWEAWRQWLSAD